jgi:hypothetical protein
MTSNMGVDNREMEVTNFESTKISQPSQTNSATLSDLESIPVRRGPIIQKHSSPVKPIKLVA